MEAWLQSSDLTSKDIAPDRELIVDILTSHDWGSEEIRMKEFEREGIENCPAGLGLVSGKGHILHICPSSKEIIIYYHYQARVLGFLWSASKTNMLVKTKLDQTEELVTAFFNENWKLLENAT